MSITRTPILERTKEMASDWFIEETTPDGYIVVADNLNEYEALTCLAASSSTNRLEMWSAAHAASPKGFVPAAYRQGSTVMVSNTLRMLSREVE